MRARGAGAAACRTSCARPRPRADRPQRRHARRLRARARLGLRGDHRRRLPRASASSAPRRRWWSRSRSEIEEALENPVDYKSVLQERLARRAEVVAYRTVSEEGPAHDRSFIARGRGGRGGARPRGGKDEEGRRAGGGPARPRRLGRSGGLVMHLRSISMKGFKSFPDPDQARVRPGRVRGRRPERVGQVEHHRRRAVGARRAVAAGGARAGDEGRDLRGRRTACRARTRPRSRS